MMPGVIHCEAQQTLIIGEGGVAVDARANRKRNEREFGGFYFSPLSPLQAPNLPLLQYFI